MEEKTCSSEMLEARFVLRRALRHLAATPTCLQTLFEMALGATSKLLRNRIITSSDDRIGVYIIGSVRSANLDGADRSDNFLCAGEIK